MAEVNQRICVLFLAEELRMGGAETYFYRLESMIDRSRVEFFSMAVPSGHESMLAHPELFSNYSFSLCDRVISIIRFLRNHDVDIVHANSLRLCIAAIVAKKVARANFRIVYTKHNLTKLEKVGSKPLVYLINHYVDALIAICETDERVFIAEGVKKRLVFRINNSVDLERFNFRQRFPLDPNKEYRIGILARLSPEKRHDLFLEIAEKFHSGHSNSVFLIGGDGQDSSKIDFIIKKNRLSGFVSMLGKVEASSFLDNIDIMLLVSDREGLPMSILEGMASGCAVIARSVGGVGDIVRKDTGVLVHGSHSETYVEALEQVIEDPLFASKTASARELVEKQYSLVNSLEQHVELYTAIGNRGATR